MNCTTCNNNLEAYISGKLSAEATANMSKHIHECKACEQAYTLWILSEKVIAEETAMPYNPYLSTRVMAAIEALEQKRIPKYTNILRPVLLTTLIVVAILTGVVAGSLYKPIQMNNLIPEELVYINDAKLESLSVLTNE